MPAVAKTSEIKVDNKDTYGGGGGPCLQSLALRPSPPLELSTAAAATGVRAHKSFPACAAQLLLTAPLIMRPQYIVVLLHLVMRPCNIEVEACEIIFAFCAF